MELASSAGFEAEVAPHRRALLSYCYRMLGSWSDAEDAVQEALVRAWKGLAGFEGRSQLRSWLFQIATRVPRPHRAAKAPPPARRGAPGGDGG